MDRINFRSVLKIGSYYTDIETRCYRMLHLTTKLDWITVCTNVKISSKGRNIKHRICQITRKNQECLKFRSTINLLKELKID